MPFRQIPGRDARECQATVGLLSPYLKNRHEPMGLQGEGKKGRLEVPRRPESQGLADTMGLFASSLKKTQE